MAQKVELRIDDVLVYPPDGTTPPAPPPTPPPVPPPVVVPPGVRMASIPFPVGDENQTMVDILNRTGEAPVAVAFTVPPGTPPGEIRIAIVEIGLGRRTAHIVALSARPGDWTNYISGGGMSVAPTFYTNTALLRAPVYYINIKSIGTQRSDVRVQLAIFPQ